jgi:orotate phosphoribosyltransferase
LTEKVKQIAEIIEANMVRSDTGHYLDFWRMMGKPENMEIVGDELQRKIRKGNYDITAAIDEEGLVLSTIIGRRIGIGMCNAFSRYISDNVSSYYISPKGGVKDKNVLLTTGEITDGYKHLAGANRIIVNGGKPKAIATLIDYDKSFEVFREGKTTEEKISELLKEDIDVIPFVRESDFKL